MTSALLAGSAQMMVLFRPAPEAGVCAPRRRRRLDRLRCARDLLLELRRDLFGVGVAAGSAPGCRRRSAAGYPDARSARACAGAAPARRSMSTLLERSSATSLTAAAAPSAACLLLIQRVETRTISAAEAFCSGITSTSASPTWSMRSMMRMMRFTLLARSEMMRMLAAGSGRELAVLRHQRPQDRHQLRRADVLHRDHLGDDLIRARADMVGQVVGRDTGARWRRARS